MSSRHVDRYMGMWKKVLRPLHHMLIPPERIHVAEVLKINQVNTLMHPITPASPVLDQ